MVPPLLRRFGAVVLLALLAACAEAPKPPTLSFQPASFASLPGWQADATAAALPALARSCTKILSRSPDRGLDGLAQYGPPDDWRPFCTALRSEEHTSELQSPMRISYAVFCLK